MNTRTRVVSRAAAISVCGLLFVAGPTVGAMTDVVTLEGTIEAVEYGEDGGVVSVAIYDSEWGAVLISGAGKGEELLSHVGAVARIQGEIEEISEDEEFRYVISVDSYEIEEAAEPDEEPGPDDVDLS